MQKLQVCAVGLVCGYVIFFSQMDRQADSTLSLKFCFYSQQPDWLVLKLDCVILLNSLHLMTDWQHLSAI